MKTAPTIGGLPAELFVGRRVRFHHQTNASYQHAMSGRLLEVSGRRATVQPEGHRATERIDLKKILPWWSQNKDLKELRKTHPMTANLVTTMNPVEVTNTPPAPIKQPEQPTLQAPVEPPPPPPKYKPGTSLIIPLDAGREWLPYYDAYLSAKRDVDEAERMLEDSETRMHEALGTLQSMGVRIGNPDAASKAKAGRPRKAKKTGTGGNPQPPQLMGGISARKRGAVVDSLVKDWIDSHISRLGPNEAYRLSYNQAAEVLGLSPTSGGGYFEKMFRKLIEKFGLPYRVNRHEGNLVFTRK